MIRINPRISQYFPLLSIYVMIFSSNMLMIILARMGWEAWHGLNCNPPDRIIGALSFVAAIIYGGRLLAALYELYRFFRPNKTFAEENPFR